MDNGSNILTISIFIIAVVGLFCFGIYFISRALKNFYGKKPKDFKPLLYVQKSYDKLRSVSRIPCGVLYIIADYKSSVSTFDEARLEKLVLSHISGTVLASFEDKTDSISQIKNGEYLVLTRMSESKLLAVIEQIRQDIMIFSNSGAQNSEVKLYFGAYLIPANDINFEETVLRAKLAAVKAKESGRSYVAWDYGLQVNYNNKTDVENELKKGVKNNNFFLELQPVIDITNGNIIGGEALTRFNNKSKVLMPSDFIPAVKSKNMDTEFDDYIFDKTCRWISLHPEICKYLNYISVNISRNTLSVKGFAEQIIEKIDGFGIERSFIAVELLEDTGKDNYSVEIIKENLSVFKRYGITIFLDDFGDGYSSFDDLKNYPIDVIKISKSITENLGTQIGIRIFNSIVNVAKNIGASIICEGAENSEQIEILRNSGIEYVQGYYFYCPLSPDNFEEAVKNNRTKIKENK